MLLSVTLTLIALFQDASSPARPAPRNPAPNPPPSAPSAQAPAPPARSQAELEKEFEKTMTGVVLTGTFRMVGKGMGRDEPSLSEPIAERYEIVKVSKILDDSWLIEARIQFAQRDATVPVAVRVVWAGDTPVITLDKAAIPLIGTYSARVMIYGGYYSGMWFGDGYGGIMSGQITKAPTVPAGSASSAPAPAPSTPTPSPASTPAPPSSSPPAEAPKPAPSPPARPRPV